MENYNITVTDRELSIIKMSIAYLGLTHEQPFIDEAVNLLKKLEFIPF